MEKLTLRQIFDTKLTLRSDKWDPYFDVYETWLSKYRDQKPVFMEVGIQGGGSMQMWKEYFGEGAIIYGVDVDERVKELPLDGINVFVGDQSNPHFWNKIVKDLPDLDAFVDDGGHTMMQQINTLLFIWPKIKEGGVYICEDTHTSYWQAWGGGFGLPENFINYTKNLIDMINVEHIQGATPPQTMLDLFGDIGSIHYYNSQIVMTKGKPKFTRSIVNG